MPRSGLKRDTIDKFYTKTEISDKCITDIKNNLTIDFNTDLIIEPSAGDGSFINGIKSICKNYLFYDIKPEHIDIKQQDYILLEHNTIIKNFNKIHIIGNPPFGRQSSIAFKFIKKSCEFCDSISFVLPKSFKKDSFKSKIDLNFHLIYEIDIPEKSFLLNGEEYDVPCVFQIWNRKEYKRDKSQKIDPENFKFVKKEEDPDISFRRVGVNAGFIDKNTDKSIQSHYFIKFTNNKSIEENLEKLRDIEFDFNNTVGPKSISKQELIQKFNLKLIV